MIVSLLLACSGADPVPVPAEPVPAPAPAAEAPYWVKRTDLELDALLTATCKEAEAAGKPVLLAFSAPWCGDCRKVRELEGEEPLKGELDHWAKVVVDVGRFDQHTPLREAFGVAGIAHWVALRPACSEPVAGWPRLDAGTFEPASNPNWPRSAAELAAWLRTARAR